MNRNLGQQFYHATPYDLEGQTHLLPPSETGREPHWEDMAPEEAHQVFMSPSVESAHGWGGEIGKDYRIYQVQPEGEVEGVHTLAAARARIVRRVH